MFMKDHEALSEVELAYKRIDANMLAFLLLYRLNGKDDNDQISVCFFVNKKSPESTNVSRRSTCPCNKCKLRVLSRFGQDLLSLR